MKAIKILIAISLVFGGISVASAKEWKPGKNRISYISDGDMVAAHLYLPDDYEIGKKYPAIVFTPPATGVKEQTIGVYAERLSKKGYVTLAFDPRGWGESEGIPMFLDPYRFADDAKNAVSYLINLEMVDSKNIFNSGICMGSGFAALATVMDARVKALVVVSPYLDGSETFLKNARGSSAALRKTMLALAGKGRQQYYETGKPITIKVVPETQKEIDAAPTEIAKGMANYYLPGKPGNVPTWKNGFNVMTAEHLITWSIYNFTHLYEGIPSIVVYGEKAASKDGAERFYQQINGPKERVVVKGANHFDLYWKPRYVDPTVVKIDAFLKKHTS